MVFVKPGGGLTIRALLGDVLPLLLIIISPPPLLLIGIEDEGAGADVIVFQLLDNPFILPNVFVDGDTKTGAVADKDVINGDGADVLGNKVVVVGLLDILVPVFELLLKLFNETKFKPLSPHIPPNQLLVVEVPALVL